MTKRHLVNKLPQRLLTSSVNCVRETMTTVSRWVSVLCLGMPAPVLGFRSYAWNLTKRILFVSLIPHPSYIKGWGQMITLSFGNNTDKLGNFRLKRNKKNVPLIQIINQNRYFPMYPIIVWLYRLSNSSLKVFLKFFHMNSKVPPLVACFIFF